MSRRTASATGEWAAAHSPVVVGVDGSEGSTSALLWAAREAARTGADLRLVAVVEERHLPRFPPRLGHDEARKLLDRLAATVEERVPAEQVSTDVYDGRAVATILEHLDRARLLVVGKRGLSTLPRLIVGSTSLALAGRADIPVVVVPTGWDDGAHQTQPIVVGLDPYQEHRHLIQLAFRRAQHLGVALVAVHGWEAPGAAGWKESQLASWEAESHQEFHRALARWQERYPDVDVQPVASPQHPAVAVLDAAERGARLVVLGRRHVEHVPGFGFGSVTRAVLHYATVPVLVVPATPA